MTIMASPLFIFYLIISGNYLAQLFGCKVQYILSHSQLMKHIMGFLTMTFFVVFSDSTMGLQRDTGVKLMYALMLYVWFVLSTKTHWVFTGLLMLILGVIYIMQVYKSDIDEKNKSGEMQGRSDMLVKWEKRLQVMAMVVTAIGFLVYVGDKSIEYGDNWSWYEFFKGEVSCKHEHVKHMTDFAFTNEYGRNLFQRVSDGVNKII